jgi:FAD/FMN-containing dehydrogenase
VQAVADRLAPYAKGAYLNFLDAADEDRLDEVYSPETRRRLAAVKRRYDPRNAFHRNLNIRPSR